MNHRIREMDKMTARKIANWQYQEPYSIYSMDGSKEVIEELMNKSYYAVFKNNDLIGYFCYGAAAQVPIGNEAGAYDDKGYIDLGVGLKPELCGKGYGFDFIILGLDYIEKIISKNKFRLTVAKFNKRAIKVYQRIGFQKTDICFNKEVAGEQIEFITMRLEDKSDIK